MIELHLATQSAIARCYDYHIRNTMRSCLAYQTSEIRPCMIKPFFSSLLSNKFNTSTTNTVLLIQAAKICRAEIVLCAPNYFTKKLKLIFLVGSNNNRGIYGMVSKL